MNKQEPAVSRRSFVKFSGAASLLLLGGALLEACGGSASTSVSSAPAASSAAPKPASSGAAPASSTPASAAAPSAAAASPAAGSGASTGAASGGNIKIGFLSTFTGDQAPPGNSLFNGFDLFLSQNGNKLGGRTVDLVKGDGASNPKTGLDQAKKLIEQDKVDVLAGVILTPTIYAIHDYIPTAPRKVMVVDANAGGNDLDTKLKSDYIVRVSFSNAQANIPMGPYVAKDMGIKTVVIASEDYAAGHEKMDAFQKGFEASGGKVVGSVYAPLATVDFAAYLPKIQQAKPDATYAFYSGSDALHFIQQYSQFGLSKTIKLTGCTDMVDDSVLQSEGQAAVGAITTGQWSNGIDTPENKKFMADYKAKYNKDADMFSEQGYDAGYLIDLALKKTGGDADPAKLLAAMLGQKWTAPRGPVSISEQYHDIVQNIYVSETKMVNGKLVNSITHTFEAVPPVAS